MVNGLCWKPGNGVQGEGEDVSFFEETEVSLPSFLLLFRSGNKPVS